jgi:glutamine synthetase
MQHFSMPSRTLGEDLFEEGIGFDGSSIRGFQEIQESDMLLVPDPNTALIDPFCEHKTLDINCFVRDPVTLESYSRDPRYVAQKAEAYLGTTGVADSCYFGPEAEFFVFDDVRYSQDSRSAFYQVDSVEGHWNMATDEGPNLGYKIRPKEGYFPVPPADHFQDLRSEMILTMERLGIEIEVHHHEVATAGQAEIDMLFDTLLVMADKLMMYKYVVKNVANAAGYTATFMPKPLFQDNGSGMHCHQSLWKNGVPLFHGEGYGGLSDMGRWYIGGLLRHASAVLAFAAPTTNSYKRLVPGYEARRVPLPRPLLQPVPCLLGDADGGPRRRAEPDRAARPDGQGPLRPPARGAGKGAPGAELVGRRPGRAGIRPRLLEGRRGVHRRLDRDLDRVQAHKRGRRHPSSPTPMGVHALLRHLDKSLGQRLLIL